MNDPKEIANNELCQLSAAEKLLRHQLNVAHYWQAQSEATEVVVKGLGARPGSLPSKWALLRDVALHDWQSDCKTKWFAAGRRGVVKVVTGAGKTICALAIAEDLQNIHDDDLHVAVVVPTIVLMQQWYDALVEHSNLPPNTIGRLGGGNRDDFSNDRRILISVLASASKLLPDRGRAANIGKHLLLIVDECHRAGAKKMSNVLNVPRAYSLGLSATPERDDAPELDVEDAAVVDAAEESFDDTLVGQELGPIIYELNFAQAIERGILPKFEVRHYGLPLKPQERTAYEKYSREITELREALQKSSKAARAMGGGALVGWARNLASRPNAKMGHTAAQYVQQISKRKQLLYRADARCQAVVNLLRQAFDENPDTRAILFHESVAEVMHLFDILRKEGFAVVPENYKLTDSLRAESIDQFRHGIAKVLVSARSLIEGFDVPAADVGIVVASSSSVRQRIQTLGRILRKSKRTSGAQKEAALHVLYMSKTVDELVYEKTDWARLTGAERNSYFLYDPSVEQPPLEQPGPPRTPPPDETDIDLEKLQPGDAYPGRYDGIEFSCDTKGNIFDADDRLVANPQGVDQLVYKVKDSYGRFKVTPKKKAILVVVPKGEGWVTRLAGKLPEPFEIRDGTPPCVDVDAANLRPGDEYAGDISSGEEYIVKRRARTALVAKRVRGGEVYARTSETAHDLRKGKDAEAVVNAVQDASAKDGDWISRFKVNSQKHAIYLAGGKGRFLVALSSGFEFPESGEE